MRANEFITNENWQKTNKRDKTDGMSKKAVSAYRRENPGSKLKTAVTTKPSKLKAGSKDAKRRKSFCARMSGNKGPMKDKKGRPTPKAKALSRWNCESIEEMQDLIMIAEQKVLEMRKLLEADLNLADALRAAAEEQRAAQQPGTGQPADPNAVQQSAGTQGTQGTASPSQVTPGGAPSPQPATPGAAKKPMGIGASFAAGLTKGKSQQLGPDGKPIGLSGVAKQGVKNIAANQLGMSNTMTAMGGTSAQKPEEFSTAFKPGQTIDLPNVGKIKVTKSGPQGIELDTSQAASIGVPKLTLNPRDLLQR